MNLIGQVDTKFIRRIENRLPAFRQFAKAQFHQSSRALWPGIHGRPEERARKGWYDAQAQVARSLDRLYHLVDSPLGALLWVPLQRCRSKIIEQCIVGRVYRDKLAYLVRRKFGDSQLVATPLQVITILFRLSRFIDVNQTAIPGWNLQADEAHFSRPRADVFQRIIWGSILRELR